MLQASSANSEPHPMQSTTSTKKTVSFASVRRVDAFFRAFKAFVDHVFHVSRTILNL